MLHLLRLRFATRSTPIQTNCTHRKTRRYSTIPDGISTNYSRISARARTVKTCSRRRALSSKISDKNLRHTQQARAKSGDATEHREVLARTVRSARRVRGPTSARTERMRRWRGAGRGYSLRAYTDFRIELFRKEYQQLHSNQQNIFKRTYQVSISSLFHYYC